jgi:hypothetical protein
MLEKRWRAAAIGNDGVREFILACEYDTKEEAERIAKRYPSDDDKWRGAIEVTYNWPAEAEQAMTPAAPHKLDQAELFEEKKS